MWTACLKFLLLCCMLSLILWTQNTFLSSTGTLYSWNLSECSETSDIFNSTSYTGAVCMGTNKENSSWGYQFLFYDIAMYDIYKCHNYNVNVITCSLQLWFKATILDFLRKTNNHWVCTMSDTMSSLDDWSNVNCYNEGFSGNSVVKNPSANAGDKGSIPGWGRSSGEGHGNPLQYSCLEIPRTEESGGRQSKESQKSRPWLSN